MTVFLAGTDCQLFHFTAGALLSSALLLPPENGLNLVPASGACFPPHLDTLDFSVFGAYSYSGAHAKLLMKHLDKEGEDLANISTFRNK